ncbi:MAG: extracellular solute-binding protein [Deltaproteobacteria bacterium]|nr:extracellular solute-binding protein [Deltaproteobacteria bacterium]
MKAGFFKTVTSSMVLASCLLGSYAFAASAGPALQKAKQEADAKGFIFETSHDEIVARAKKEGLLRGLVGFEPQTIRALKEGFSRRYPFINTQFEEITGPDSAQRFLLELKAGRASSWDIAHLSPDFHNDYLPFLEKIDLLGMARQGVLQIHSKMISPESRNAIAISSIVDLIAYNKKVVPQDKLPRTWDDLLKPEYKGRKFVMDIKPNSMSALVPSMGIDWVLDYARKLAAQQPIWARGHTRYLTGMAEGEYALFVGTYYHSVMRLRQRGAKDLEVLILEPVPVRVTETHGIVKGASHPYSAVLFFEYVAGLEGQKILYEVEPFKSSIYSPGSKAEELVRGKRISVIDWQHIVKQQEYMDKIFAAYGFPKAGGSK